MLLELLRFRAFREEACKHVDCLVHRPNVDIIRRFVFHSDGAAQNQSEKQQMKKRDQIPAGNGCKSHDDDDDDVGNA